nr:ceramide transfer protein-like [Cherax quadricarinatus]
MQAPKKTQGRGLAVKFVGQQRVGWRRLYRRDGASRSKLPFPKKRCNRCISSSKESEIMILNKGTVSKWTNYIHGWQNRYMVLKDGTMSYYRNPDETAFGCRGSISVQKAHVKPHEIDECRFDVCLNDCVWYLRTNTEEEKHQWVDAVEQHKYLESEGLRRHGSTIFTTSNTFSTTSGSSLKKSKG